MKFHWYLYPIAWIYGLVVFLRNELFDAKILRSRSFQTPVISVGNITVGGTGKTPHTEYLISFLQKQFKVAMVSRGYKRTSKGLQVSSPLSDSHQLGDEPYQVYRRFPATLVVADANRCEAIDYIEKEHPDTEVVILDDAFQHRKVEPGQSILLIDYNRLITKDKLLPVGRLREQTCGKYRASIIIVTKCPKGLKPIHFRTLLKEIEPRPYQKLYFSSFRYGKLKPLFTRGVKKVEENMHLLVVTSIATPAPLYQHLKEKTEFVQTLAFADHHRLTKEDWKKVEAKFMSLPPEERYIVVTDKDAAKIVNDPDVPESLREFIYSIPVKVSILQSKEAEFQQNLIDYVSKNQPNR